MLCLHSTLEIFTIRPDGSEMHRVTKNTTGDYYPAYSPSGKRIAYNRQDGRDLDIFTIGIDGTNRRQVTRDRTHDFWPAYSPSGNRIAYTKQIRFDHELFTIGPMAVIGTDSPTMM